MPIKLSPNTILLLALVVVPTSAFIPPPLIVRELLTQQGPKDAFVTTCASTSLYRSVTHASRNDYGTAGNENRLVSKAYKVSGILSAAAWVAVSCVALSHHPDPKFAHCGFRHNAMTTAQALAFPLSIGWASISALHKAALGGWDDLGSVTSRRLNLGLGHASIWLGLASAFPSAFAFGYDLYPPSLKIGASVLHFVTALLAFSVWRHAVSSTKNPISRIVQGLVGSLWNLTPRNAVDDPERPGNVVSLYALVAAGFTWFAVLPVVSPYPLATIPTILGKRLSRPASAFTFLGAVLSYCLKDAAERGNLDSPTMKTLRHGLFFGSIFHVFLIALKVIGVDGGGVILPGRGLWEVYPAMLAVPFAASISVALHLLACLAASVENRPVSI